MTATAVHSRARVVDAWSTAPRGLPQQELDLKQNPPERRKNADVTAQTARSRGAAHDRCPSVAPREGRQQRFPAVKLGTPLLIAVEKGRKVRILLQGHCQSSEGPILVSLCFSVKSKQLANWLRAYLLSRLDDKQLPALLTPKDQG